MCVWLLLFMHPAFGTDGNDNTAAVNALVRHFSTIESVDLSASFDYTTSKPVTAENKKDAHLIPNILSAPSEGASAIWKTELRFRMSGSSYRIDKTSTSPFLASVQNHSIIHHDAKTFRFDWKDRTLYSGGMSQHGASYPILVPILLPFQFATCNGEIPTYETLREPSIWESMASNARWIGDQSVNNIKCSIFEIECHTVSSSGSQGSLYRVFLAPSLDWYPLRYEIFELNNGTLQQEFRVIEMGHFSDEGFHSFQSAEAIWYDPSGDPEGKLELKVTNLEVNGEIRPSIYSIPESHIDNEIVISDDPANTSMGIQTDIQPSLQLSEKLSVLLFFLGGCIAAFGLSLMRKPRDKH